MVPQHILTLIKNIFVSKLLADFNYLLMLINLVLYLLRFRKFDKALRIFTIYLFVIAIIQLTTRYYSRHGLNNLFLSHFYFLLQFILLSFFYKTLLPVKTQKMCVIGGLVLCSLILGIQYYQNPSLFYKLNLFEIFITSFLLVIYALFHYYNILNESKEVYYLNTGVFVYIFGSTVLFLSVDILTTLDPSYGRVILTLNALLYVVFHVFVYLEWWKHRKTDLQGE
jgi:hypothetical protein